MKKLLTFFLLLCPFLMAHAASVPHKLPAKSQTTKQSVKSSKQIDKKSKNSVKKDENKKKSAKKIERLVSEKGSQKTKSAKEVKNTKGKRVAEKTKSSQVTKGALKGEMEKSLNKAAVSEKTSSRSVIVPNCQDISVLNVLSDAFRQQGYATRKPMTVKHVSQIKETRFYANKGIRSCYANVNTQGGRYATDYSIILNDNGFFVQVENARIY